MNSAAWIVFVLNAAIAAGAGALIPPLWRVSRKVPEMRSGLVVWAVLAGLAASVPVVVLVTGRTGWYPRAVGVTAVVIAAGYGWVKRGAIAAALRRDDAGDPPDRPLS